MATSIHPLMQTSGRRRATRRARPACSAAVTTALTFLVGTRRLLGDTAHRRTPDENTSRCKVVYDLASAPLLKRGVPRKRPSGAVACRGKRLGFGRRFADQNIGAGAHAAADKHRLANGAQCFGQAFMSGPKGPVPTSRRCRSLARSETFAGWAPDILPCSSILSRSRSSPQPHSTAQAAPPANIASMSISSSVMGPLLPTPAGIWRNSEFGERLLHWKNVGNLETSQHRAHAA